MLQIVQCQIHLRLLLNITIVLGKATGVIIVVRLKMVIPMRETMIKGATPIKKVGEALDGAGAGIVGMNERPCPNESCQRLVRVHVAEGVAGHIVQKAERTRDLHWYIHQVLSARHPLLDLDIMMIVLRRIPPMAVPERMSSVAI
jgi:hypothetical protein